MNLFSARHQWLTLLLPSLGIVIMLFALDWLTQASLIFRAQLQVLPYFAAFMTIVLATQFHQYRFVYLSAALTLSYMAYAQLFSAHTELSPLGLYWGMALVSSAAFIYVLQMQETYPWHWLGMTKMVLLILPFLLLLQPQVTFVLRDITQTLPEVNVQRLSPNIWASPVTGFLFVLVVLVAIRGWWQRKDAASGAAVPIVIASFGAMSWLSEPVVGLALFVGASIALMSNIFLQAWAYAYRDELTGIASRRAFQQFTHRLGKKYVIAMVDVDHFKAFNDTYGHDVGDDVLRIVASRLRRVGGGGKVFRLGGEEFAVVFARKKIEQAVAELEMTRKSIANNPITIRDVIKRPEKDEKGAQRRGKRSQSKRVRITVSMGVAEPNSLNKKPKSVLRLADQMLYRAKEQGRNQIVA